MSNEAMAARNTVSWAQARSLADGAIHRTVFELMRPKVSPDVWAPDGAVRIWEEDGARIAVRAIDESGKIDLNSAPDALLKGLLMTAGGVDEPTAARLVDAIGDWKDADDLRRPNGAEAEDYKAAGSPYLPANAPFETVPELQRVLGLTPALYAKLAENLTVQSQQAGNNPTYYTSRASSPWHCGQHRSRRHLSCPTARRVGGKIAAAAVSADRIRVGPLNLWRIRAEVTMGDGVSFVREAVVRPGYQQRLMTVLEWQEGNGKVLKTAAEEQSGTRTQ
jgi:general secretion pathway protein K